MDKKLILLDNKYVIEFGRNQIHKYRFPFKLFSDSYGFTYKQDLYFLHLLRKFTQKRMKINERHIHLENIDPILEIEKWSQDEIIPFNEDNGGHVTRYFGLLYGPGIQIMDFYWMIGEYRIMPFGNKILTQSILIFFI